MKICSKEYRGRKCKYSKCYHYAPHIEDEVVGGHFCGKCYCGAVRTEVVCVEIEVGEETFSQEKNSI